jgi:hypothetical protein
MKHQLERKIAFWKTIISVLTLTSMVGCIGVSEQSKVGSTNNNKAASSSPSLPSQPTAPTSPDKLTDTVNRKEALAEARAILRDIKSIELEGRGIPRRTQAAQGDCLNKINARWQRIQALRERVKRLPKVLQIYLGVAASELINCVSCESDALSLCAQARDWIKEAENDIAEYEQGKI